VVIAGSADDRGHLAGAHSPWTFATMLVITGKRIHRPERDRSHGDHD
jgi:hypothetical protein